MGRSKNILDLKVGESAFIKECSDPSYTCKLLTLGFLPKARVKVVRKAPMGGALYLKINDYQIAVRKAEAKSILIE